MTLSWEDKRKIDVEHGNVLFNPWIKKVQNFEMILLMFIFLSTLQTTECQMEFCKCHSSLEMEYP